MNLLDRLKLLVQSTVTGAVEDLIGGDSRRSTSSPISTGDTDRLLRQADKRLETLRDRLASTVAREKRAEHAWREAGAKAMDLNSEVDALLRNNQSDDARARLQQAQRAAEQTAELEQELQRFAKMSVQLREEIAVLEDQLGQIRQRVKQAGEHQSPVEVVAPVPQTQQAQRKENPQVEPAVQARPEHIASPEDKQTAGAEVEEAVDAMDSSRMADVLKKLQEQRNQQNNKS